jgi:C1A family cysteine protease
MSIREHFESPLPQAVPSEEDLAESVDWIGAGGVNEIQDQGNCGSCWSFSATASIEGAHFARTGELLKLSEQQFIDCTKRRTGCKGGWYGDGMKSAYDQPQELLKDYKYTKSQNRKCLWRERDGKVRTEGYSLLKPSKNLAVYKAAVMEAPISVTVNSAVVAFKNYKSGIINSMEDCPEAFTHAVNIVGYGVEGDQEYWMVRNSWGTKWGDQGYVKIGINGDGPGICGIQSFGAKVRTTDL